MAKKPDKIKISVSLDSELIRFVDSQIEARVYRNRSHFFDNVGLAFMENAKLLEAEKHQHKKPFDDEVRITDNK